MTDIIIKDKDSKPKQKYKPISARGIHPSAEFYYIPIDMGKLDNWCRTFKKKLIGCDCSYCKED